MDDEQRRCDRQPALFLIAQELCCTGMTDGFCMPQHAEGCNCWVEASRFQQATGLSANACVWVLKNRTRIEKEAAGSTVPAGVRAPDGSQK